MSAAPFDAAVIGGGPAGLMAAEVLKLVDLPVDRKGGEPASGAPGAARGVAAGATWDAKLIPWMQSPVELRALYLMALQIVDPASAKTSDVADWLMGNRVGSRWSPEKTNGPAVALALETGSTPVAYLCNTGLLLALDAAGRRAECRAVLERMQALAAGVRGGWLRFNLALWEAYLLHCEGTDGFRAPLAAALGLGRREGYFHQHLGDRRHAHLLELDQHQHRPGAHAELLEAARDLIELLLQY